MLRRRRFGVTEGQVHIEYIDIIARRFRFVLAEIGTEQKYPQISAYGGSSLLIGPSDNTVAESYDPEAALTMLHFPPWLRGWEILPEGQGRYTLRVTFYKPGRRKGCERIAVPPGIIDWNGRLIP
jgi:hypothetical protein